MEATRLQQHVAHKARRERLWNPPAARKVIEITAPEPQSEPVVVQMQSPDTAPDHLTPDESRRQRLNALEEELCQLRKRVREEIKKMEPDDPTPDPRPPIELIIRVVAAFYQTSSRDLKSNGRHQGIVRPRHIAMYLANRLTFRSLPEIGRRLGNRDHSTIFHGVRKIEHLITIDPTLAAEIEQLTAMLTVQKG